MRDQADTLRKLMQGRGGRDGQDQRGFRTPGVSVMTVASGKGGVGKSCLVTNLGASLARSGLRVLLVDGDSGLANLDIMLGVQASVTLEQVIRGEARIQDAIVGVEPNLWLLPAASGLMDVRHADFQTRSRLAGLFEQCPWEMDLILVDVGSGIHGNVLGLHNPIYDSTVVLTPEPTSLTDAYGLVKLLRRDVGVTRVGVVVNQVTDARDGREQFQKLKDVADRFMDVQLEFLGHVQRDEKFITSVMKRKILLDLDSGAPGARCLELLAKRVRSRIEGEENRGRDTAAGVLPAARSLTVSRFQEEPARLAPGNTAGFWRTLLGEVKA